MVVRAGMPTLPFYFLKDCWITSLARSGLSNGSAGRDAHTTILLFEGTGGLRPWIAEVSPMVVRAGMPTLPFYFLKGLLDYVLGL
jgi:hypothetical protein